MKKHFAGIIYSALLVSAILHACSSDGNPGDKIQNGDGEIVCESGAVLVDGVCEEPRTPDISENWAKIDPGGETICALGGEYSFWVRGGTVNKLLVSFAGGGACWDTVTCNSHDNAFPFYVSVVDEGSNPNNWRGGIFDLDNTENPFADWYMVHLPYCSADLFWGDVDHTYPADFGQPEITIQHKGFINGSVAMDWVYDNFNAPETIFITGGSAGAYGSMMFAPHLMSHYGNNTRVVAFADSGSGVITEEFFLNTIPIWHAQENYLASITEVSEKPLDELSIVKVYIASANFFPNQVFSQFNTARDTTQEGYYIAMGGVIGDWAMLMEAAIEDISSNASNFRYYTGWGERHTILYSNNFYTYMVNGLRIRDWVADLAEGADVGNIHCTDCEAEEYYQPSE